MITTRSPRRGGVYDGENAYKACRLSNFEAPGKATRFGRGAWARIIPESYVQFFNVDSSDGRKGGIMNNDAKKKSPQMLEHLKSSVVQRKFIIADYYSIVNQS